MADLGSVLSSRQFWVLTPWLLMAAVGATLAGSAKAGFLALYNGESRYRNGFWGWPQRLTLNVWRRSGLLDQGGMPMQLSVFVPSRALARRLAILTLLVGGTEAVLLGLGGLLLPSEWFKVVYCTNLPAGAVSAMMIYVGWGRAYLLGCLNAYAVSALAALGAAALKRLACSIVLALRASSMGLAVPDTCGWEGAKLDPFVAFMLMFGTSIGWFSIALQEWKARRDQQRG